MVDLPHSLAVGLAARHALNPAQLAERGNLTAHEQLRLQRSAERNDAKLDVNLGRVPLTRLALFALSKPLTVRQEQQDDLHAALQTSARRALRRRPLKLGRVAAIFDRSYSSSGSGEKRRRPLGVARAARYLLAEACDDLTEIWTGPPLEHPVQVVARGSSNLADGILEALRAQPDHIFIVSDGYENDPPRGAAECAQPADN